MKRRNIMREFDINDNQLIHDLVSLRAEGAYVMPLYIEIYNDIVDIRNIDSITNFTPSSLKIGFGSVCGVFQKNQFPLKYIDHFDIISTFSMFDSVINNDLRYYVFESSDPYGNIEHPIFEQMSYYYWTIRERLEENQKKVRLEKIRKSMEENES